MRRILVDCEPRTVRRQLEQHAARLEEVHRLEPESIDHWRRPPPSLVHMPAHFLLMRIVIHAPGDVMHAADTPRAATRIGHFADIDVLSRPATSHAIAVPPLL
jgi:hypothetical protein